MTFENLQKICKAKEESVKGKGIRKAQDACQYCAGALAMFLECSGLSDSENKKATLWVNDLKFSILDNA